MKVQGKPVCTAEWGKISKEREDADPERYTVVAAESISSSYEHCLLSHPSDSTRDSLSLHSPLPFQVFFTLTGKNP